MGDQLWMVREACVQLTDGKVTTRKKAEGSLRDLLTNKNIVSALHSATENSISGEGFTWRNVYFAAHSFLRLEAEKIKTDERKEKQSKNAVGTRTNRRREIMSLYTLVIRKPGKDGLRWSVVARNLLELLDNEYLKELFADDIVRLLQEIISDPTCQATLGVSGSEEGHQWEQILNVVVDLLIEAPERLDVFSTVRLLRSTIKHGIDVCELTRVLYTSKVWNLIKGLLTATKLSARPDSPTQLEVIEAATLYCQIAAVNFRREVCKLGEETVHCVLQAWDERNPGTKPALDFLNLQILVHHPGGAKDVRSGSLVCNQEQWHHQLLRLHQNVVETSIRNKLRQNKARGSRSVSDYELEETFLSFSVNLLRQTLTRELETCNVTQLVPLDTTQNEAPPSKRLRLDLVRENGSLETSFRSLLEKIQTHTENDLNRVPWLQILGGLLGRFPDMFDAELRIQVLRVLSNLLQGTKSVATKKHCLSVCLNLLHATGLDKSSDWDVVTRTTLNMVSMNQAGSQGHQLFHELIHRSPIIPVQHVYSLYTNHLVKFAPDTLNTLLFMLRNHPVTDSRSISRDSLLCWLFPEQDETPGVQVSVDPSVLGEILVSLALSKVSKVSAEAKPCYKMTELEIDLLCSCHINCVLQTKPSVDPVQDIRGFILPEVETEVVKLMHKHACIMIQEPAELDLGIKSLLREAETFLFYLHGFSKRKVEYKQLAENSKIKQMAKILLKKSVEMSLKLLEKTRENVEIIFLLETWISFFQTLPRLSGLDLGCLYLQEINLFKMMEKVERTLIETCNIWEKRLDSKQPSQSSGDSGHNPFDDFDDASQSTETESNNQVDEFSADLNSLEEGPEEGRELLLVEKSFYLLVLWYSPNLEINIDLPLMAEKQSNLVFLIDRILEVFQFSHSTIKAVVFCIRELGSSINLMKDTLDKLSEILKEIAKNCMTQKKFDYVGMLGILKIIENLAQPALRLGSVKCGTVINRLLEVLLKQNSKLNYSRFSIEFTLQLVKTISKLGNPDGSTESSWLSWSSETHNLSATEDSSLGIDSDGPVPIINCLPRFLSHPSLRVRTLTTQIVMEAPEFDPRHFSSCVISLVCDDLFQVCVYKDWKKSDQLSRINSVLILCSALVSRSSSYARYAVSTILCLLRQQRCKLNLAPVLALISEHAEYSGNTGKMLKDLLPGLFFDFLEEMCPYSEFPIHELGFKQASFSAFLTHHESLVLPLILLWEPKAETMQELGELVQVDYLILVERNLDRLLQLSIPGLAAQELKIKVELKEKMAELGALLKHVLGAEFLPSLEKALPSVIYSSFSSICEDGKLQTRLGIDCSVDIRSGPPRLNIETAEAVVQFISSKFSETYDFLCQRQSHGIPQIAVELCINLMGSENQTHLRCLFSIQTWLMNLFSSSSQTYTSTLPFLVMYLSQQLLNLVKRTNSLDCKKAALVVLDTLIQQSFSKSVNSLVFSLVQINSSLLNIICEDPDSNSAQNAKGILEFLFIENIHKFKDDFDNLEDYPSLEIFSLLSVSVGKYKKDLSLTSFLRTFLRVTDLVEFKFCENILRQLKQRLKTSGTELNVLLEKDLDVVKELVIHLLTLSKMNIKSISTLALDCLGEIGPVNFKSNVLKANSAFQPSDPSKPAFAYVKPILNKLSKLLNRESGTFSRDVFNTISNILSSTQEGRELCLEDRGFNVLEPLKKKGKRNLQVPPVIQDVTRFTDEIDDEGLWVYSRLEYSSWIKVLVARFLNCFSDKSVLGFMLGVCENSLELCELILPYIIQECLLHQDENIRLVVSTRIISFFQEFQDQVGSSSTFLQDNVPVYFERRKVSALVGVVSYTRLQVLPDYLIRDANQSIWERNFWLPGLDYLAVASAALFCSSYSSALLFSDIWCIQQDMILGKYDEKPPLLRLQACNPTRISELRKIVTSASLKISDKDAYHGIKSVLPEVSETEVSFDNLPILDVQCSTSSRDGNNSLVQSLYQNGLFHLLSKYMTGVQTTEVGQNVLDVQAECAWRLGEWDNVFPEEKASSFNVSVFGCLQSFHNCDKDGVKNWLNLSYSHILDSITRTNLESSAEIYSILSKLKLLNETSLFSKKDLEGETLSILDGLLSKDDIYNDDFGHLEPVYSVRMSLLNTALIKTQPKLLERTLLTLCTRARESGRFWFCHSILETTRSLVSSEFKFEKAKVEWSRGKHSQGILLAKSLLQEIEEKKNLNPDTKQLLPELLVSLGQWMNLEKTECSKIILNKYFKRAVELLEKEGSRTESSLVEAYLGLANLADQHYKKAEEYMDSAEFKERQANINLRQKEETVLKGALGTIDKAFKQSLIIKTRFLAIDKLEIDRWMKEKETYLMTSMEYYLSVLLHGDISVAVYRMISLWFANQDNVELNSLVSKRLPNIPTYRLVPLLYQMAARMSDFKKQDGVEFSAVLFNCIQRCALEHPHHVLPIVLALKNANLDEFFENNKPPPDNHCGDARSKASYIMLRDMKKVRNFENIISKYSELSLGLVELAYHQVGKNPSKSISIPASYRYTKIKQWDDVLVPTDNVPVRPDGDYSRYPGIERFEPSFSMVGGINAPKKTVCIGTDGIRRPQLVKGKDDLRQDAVMQQVFDLTNQLLDQDRDTRKHNLRIRTYKIVPLSQRSGILEWCSNTLPIGNVLVGENRKGGVHKKYFPNHLTSAECHAAYNHSSHAKDPEKVYLKICQNFPPAMKFFLMEQFTSPEEYFKGKNCFTNSAAASSMVGHILGLGDRHINNILLDLKTGDLIHIDFGVAFDKGKILPTPELIPFRLTRDIVDGFGPTGVEGVFRSNCERSLRVLRENKDKLLTVLEVMLHDPLYDWSVGPSKAAAKQAGEWEKLKKQEDGQGNRMASRALMVLVSKLEGREDGSQLSVSGQVGALIQQATDPAKLSRVYVGWSPWC